VRGAKSAKRQTVPIEHRLAAGTHATPAQTQRRQQQVTLADNPFDAPSRARHHPGWFFAGVASLVLRQAVGRLASIDLNRVFATDLPPSPPLARARPVFHRQRYREACRRSARSDRAFWTR
jgi:hypothetical protein